MKPRMYTMKAKMRKMLGLPIDSPYDKPVAPRRMLKPVKHPSGAYG